MAIEGLRGARIPTQPNVTDHVGASVEALDRLGLVEDHDQVTESLTADFGRLTDEAGVMGEPYVQLPRNMVALGSLIEVLDSGDYAGKKYPETYRYDALWTPGSGSEGYEANEMGALEVGQPGTGWPAHARLAVYSADTPQEPLLHFLGKPFDEKYARDGELTQLKAIAEVQETYDAEHEGFSMTPLNVNAVAMIALVRRIKGETMPMDWGFMRDATLPCKSVDGGSFVGYVLSYGGQLVLDGSNGDSGAGSGVGLSVGPKDLEA